MSRRCPAYCPSVCIATYPHKLIYQYKDVLCSLAAYDCARIYNNLYDLHWHIKSIIFKCTLVYLDFMSYAMICWCMIFVYPGIL